MQSVKKVLSSRLHRYNLRSRKLNVSIVKSSTPKTDRNIQVDLSDEERETLFSELPFPSQEDKETGDEIQASSSSSQREVHQRRSTAFSCLGQENITDRELIDISLDYSSESIVPPSVPESEGHHSPSVSPVLAPVIPLETTHSSPAHIGRELEHISALDDTSEEFV